MIHLDYRDARPIYTQIMDNFRNQIRANVLAEGDKLPSVRELASELAINPNTIQRAYRELEAEGWIASVSGKGSFVCGAPRQENPETEALWKELDIATENLLKSGISRQTILQYLKQGGDTNA
jgi:GntR family transcriptional regulator